MNDAQATDLMARFGRAFFKRDAVALAEILTEDAEWHFAIGDGGRDGRISRGVEEFLQGKDENDRMFPRLRFEDVQCRALGDDTIIMTYLLDGQTSDGASFALRGVELITVRDGRLARKDVFWKQQTA